MKTKNILLLFLACVLVFSSCISNEQNYNFSEAKKYEDKLISLLENNDSVKVKDVFDFEFERAFVIEETYLKGDAFAEEYNLEISVEEMLPNNYEDSRRIVFVDKNGEFVYEFRYWWGDRLCEDCKGKVIYPNTRIVASDLGADIEGSVGIKFVIDDKDYLVKLTAQ